MSLLPRLSTSIPRSDARDFTRLSAACALSFITSPSWPVRISLPLPGMRVASINRMSPPTGVQARPMALVEPDGIVCKSVGASTTTITVGSDMV